jgi:MFS family permease
VFAVANVATGLAAGWLSDQVAQRKPFVMLGGAIIAASALGLVASHGWPLIIASYAVLGCGTGCYFAIDLALVAQVLPSNRNIGRDLGVINLAMTIPQIVAPAMAGLLLSLPGANLHWVFAASAVLAVVGAAMAAPIRGIR